MAVLRAAPQHSLTPPAGPTCCMPTIAILSTALRVLFLTRQLTSTMQRDVHGVSPLS